MALAAAQDHKRVGEGDTGPNTGGMGAYTGDGLLSKEMEQWLLKHVAQRVVDEMAMEGTPFHGILFCGMMMVPRSDGTTHPMVLEFNTRFGDPETQAILMRLETDIVELFDAAIDEHGEPADDPNRPGASVCVIAGERWVSGEVCFGDCRFRELDTIGDPDVMVFHSGTALKDGQVSTAGGRVLGVTAVFAELVRLVDGDCIGAGVEGRIAFVGCAGQGVWGTGWHFV